MHPIKHTPGPWVPWELAWEEPEYGAAAGKAIITTADGEDEVCGIVYNKDDAKLIALAPEMYSILFTIYQETSYDPSVDEVVKQFFERSDNGTTA